MLDDEHRLFLPWLFRFIFYSVLLFLADRRKGNEALNLFEMQIIAMAPHFYNRSIQTRFFSLASNCHRE